MLETILSFLAKRGSSALEHLRRGGSALRNLLGNLRALVRPLLKEGIAFLAEKLKRGVAAVREGGQKAGSLLMHFAEKFLGKRQDTEPDTSAEREEADIQEHAAAPAPVVASAPVATPPQPAPASAPIARAPSAAVVRPRESSAPVISSDALHTYGPIVGRALVRALTRRPPPDRFANFKF